MGWLFSKGWRTRAGLIKHLTEGNGIKTLKKALVGNHLWCVHEYDGPKNNLPVPIRFITLYLMKAPMFKNAKYDGADKYWWGYKDIDETAGPNEITCPASFLTMCTYPHGHYAYEWRQKVYARAARLARMKVGAVIKAGDSGYKIVKRRSPTSWELERQSDGLHMRAGISWMSQPALQVAQP